MVFERRMSPNGAIHDCVTDSSDKLERSLLTNLAFFRHWMTSGGSDEDTEGFTRDAEAS